jgi:hypothetical protein
VVTLFDLNFKSKMLTAPIRTGWVRLVNFHIGVICAICGFFSDPFESINHLTNHPLTSANGFVW